MVAPLCFSCQRNRSYHRKSRIYRLFIGFFGLTFSGSFGTILYNLFSKEGSDIRDSLKKKLLTGIILAAFVLLSWYGATVVTPEQLQRALEALGPLAAAGYIGAFTILPAFFFPVAVLALAGGLLFGLFWGSIYTFIGAILNCALMFLLARTLGRKQVQQLVRKKLPVQWQKRLEGLGGKDGALLLVILRLIPAVPYNLINYAFGLTEMKLSTYLLFSAVGIIPGTLAFINIGDKALSPGSPDFWIALGLLGLLLTVTALLGKKCFSKEKEHEQ